MPIKNLSVFFPCFNEEKNIETTVKKAVVVLEKLGLDYEVIIVNDGSSDKTGEVADQLAKKDSHIRVIHHQKNSGYGEALKSGFYGAKYDTIVYNDSDGQFDFSEVTKFIEKLDEADLVLGYRIKRKDNIIRLFNAKGWTLSLLLFFGLNLKDVDCGFKMIKKKVLEKIPHLKSTRGGMINAELAIKTQKFGFRVAQVGVHHYPRTAGKPTGANIGVIIQSYLDLLRLWWSLLPKWEFFSLLAILSLAAFLRFYRISEFMTFLGDEGRDALVIKSILVDHNLPFIGPPTSVGNMYLGPLYYYMMALPMAIFWLNPVAAAAQIALIGVLTVWLIYYLGKEWFGKGAGLLAAFLYAISPVTIVYARSSWNPNPSPFFALLAIIGFYWSRKSGNFFWLILTGFAIGAAIQMHYLALILVPVIGVVWIHTFVMKLKGEKVKNFWLGTVGAIFAFILIIFPWILFDLKHNYMNSRAILEFFANRQTTVNVNPFNTLFRITPIYSYSLITRYLTADNSVLGYLVSAIVLILSLRFLTNLKKYLLLLTWLFLGVLGLSLYKQSVYDHYLGFLSPAPYLILGSAVGLGKVISSKVGKVLLYGVFLVLITVITVADLKNSPTFSPPNNMLKRTQEVAKFVISEADNKPFNFALIAKSNYDSAYQFYLEIYGHKPGTLPKEMTDQLFVVCEDPICLPISNPKYEIAAFGWAKIEEDKVFDGVKVYKLVHNPSGKP